MRRGTEMNPGSGNVVNEGMAQHIVMDPPGEPGLAAKGHNADRRVRGRPARNLARIGDVGIKRRRPVGVDKVHHPLADIAVGKEGVVTAGENIDNGVADGQDIKRKWHLGLGGRKQEIAQVGLEKRRPESKRWLRLSANCAGRSTSGLHLPVRLV